MYLAIYCNFLSKKMHSKFKQLPYSNLIFILRCIKMRSNKLAKSSQSCCKNTSPKSFIITMCPCSLGTLNSNGYFQMKYQNLSIYYDTLRKTLSKIVMALRFVEVWVANVLFECLKKIVFLFL